MFLSCLSTLQTRAYCNKYATAPTAVTLFCGSQNSVEHRSSPWVFSRSLQCFGLTGVVAPLVWDIVDGSHSPNTDCVHPLADILPTPRFSALEIDLRRVEERVSIFFSTPSTNVHISCAEENGLRVIVIVGCPVSSEWP